MQVGLVHEAVLNGLLRSHRISRRLRFMSVATGDAVCGPRDATGIRRGRRAGGVRPL